MPAMSTSRVRATFLGFTTVALLLPLVGIAPAPAQAAARAISGTLSKGGYRVVAVTPGGDARTARVAANGAFRIVPRGPVVTLSLVTRKGRYAGPVVVGGTATRAVIGVEAGAKLGAVRVRPGWARAASVPAGKVVTSMWAKARDRKPVGAGRNGLVRRTSAGTSGAGRDQDGDGVIGAFDIDDDGDLLIDNFERTSAAPAFFAEPSSDFRMFSNFKLDISRSVNANSGNTDLIAAIFPDTVGLAIWAPTSPSTGELDCLGLTYCSTGGTGTVFIDEGGPTVEFPEGRDADGDGWGDLVAGMTGDFQLRPHAPTSAIHSGDTFIARVSSDGVAAQEERPGVLNFVFSTTPALTTWSVAGGGSGSVSYPVGDFAVGTSANPIPVPAGSATVTLTFWRPQRQAVSGESASADGFVDIGGLTYVADIPNAPSGGAGSPGRGPGTCRSGYTTTDSDAAVGGEGIVDRATDRAAHPANTLSFTLDLDACLAGVATWSSGQSLGVDIQAKTTYGDNAAQKIYFRKE